MKDFWEEGDPLPFKAKRPRCLPTRGQTGRLQQSKLGTFVESLRDPGWADCSPRLSALVRGWHNGMTMEELGQAHGIGIERVRQLLGRAKRRYFQTRPRPACLDPDLIEREWAKIEARA